jgi:F-type H+-transporting ATPase subunit b
VLSLTSDAFAVEAITRGRKIWNNIMLWVNFGILIFLFLKFAKNSLLNFLFGERNKIADMLQKVDDSVKQARSLMDAEQEKIKDIDKRLEKIKQDILEIGRNEKEKIIENAKLMATQMIEDARKQSDYKLLKAKNKFGSEMMGMAISIAIEKLRKEITTEDNQRIIDQFTSRLSGVREMVE